MLTDHPTTTEIIYTTYKYQILVEKWWSDSTARWNVNVIVKDMRPAMEIVLDVENVDQFVAALTEARDKAREIAAKLTAEALSQMAKLPSASED